MSRFLCEKLNSLKPYKPDTPQVPLKKVIKLNTNESPYPASTFVYRSMDQFEVDNLRLYSDPEASKLVKAIAEYFGIRENQIVVGNGSDELLAFAFMGFENSSRNFYFPDITYGSYAAFADAFQINKQEIPLRGGLAIDPADYMGRDGTIVLANPNTPTGLALTRDQIEGIVKSNRDNLVLIDEAYVDFGAESCIPLIEQYDNLLVVQTFSKSRNLAGARVGFAVAHPDIIEDLKRIKFSFNPYNINRLSVIAATAAIKDKDYFRRCTNDIKKTRDRFTKEMEALGFEVTDSKGNFVFVKCNSIQGSEYCSALEARNILVKHYSRPEINHYVRITIGSPDEMNAVIKATKSILGIEEPRGE